MIVLASVTKIHTYQCIIHFLHQKSISICSIAVCSANKMQLSYLCIFLNYLTPFILLLQVYSALLFLGELKFWPIGFILWVPNFPTLKMLKVMEQLQIAKICLSTQSKQFGEATESNIFHQLSVTLVFISKRFTEKTFGLRGRMAKCHYYIIFDFTTFYA